MARQSGMPKPGVPFCAVPCLWDQGKQNANERTILEPVYEANAGEFRINFKSGYNFC